jgi:hypothetical protein
MGAHRHVHAKVVTFLIPTQHTCTSVQIKVATYTLDCTSRSGFYIHTYVAARHRGHWPANDHANQQSYRCMPSWQLRAYTYEKMWIQPNCGSTRVASFLVPPRWVSGRSTGLNRGLPVSVVQVQICSTASDDNPERVDLLRRAYSSWSNREIFSETNIYSTS